MSNNLQVHLTEEEVIAYILNTIPNERLPTFDRHLARCAQCATILESFYETHQTFPAQAWSSRRAGFVRRLRNHLIPLPQRSWLDRFSKELGKLTLPRGDWSLSLATAHAATDRQSEDGQTADGTLRWRIGEDEERNLVIRLGSHQTDLAGAILHLWLGGWQAEVVLQKVAPDQVGVEVLIPAAQRLQLETDATLQIAFVSLEMARN